MAAIGQMSSTISHQILQKIGLLGLQCALLRDSLEDESTKALDSVVEARGRVESLDASITDLNTTLSDLLVFSRDLAVHLEPGSLDELLDDVCMEVQTVAISRGIQVRYRPSGVEEWNSNEYNVGELVVSLDRVKLKQAILNILSNALEASQEGDRVVTYKHGALPIGKIGKATLLFGGKGSDYKKKMYRLTKRDQMTDDLLVTGRHGMLVDAGDWKAHAIHKNRVHARIDDKVSLMAANCSLFEVETEAKTHTIYHFALDGAQRRYGVYANGGALMESLDKQSVSHI